MQTSTLASLAFAFGLAGSQHSWLKQTFVCMRYKFTAAVSKQRLLNVPCIIRMSSVLKGLICGISF